MQQELREKIIFLIDSKDLREYLLSIQEEILDENLLNTIGVAPVDLEEKFDLLRAFTDDKELPGSGWKRQKRLPKR